MTGYVFINYDEPDEKMIGKKIIKIKYHVNSDGDGVFTYFIKYRRQLLEVVKDYSKIDTYYLN